METKGLLLRRLLELPLAMVMVRQIHNIIVIQVGKQAEINTSS